MPERPTAQNWNGDFAFIGSNDLNVGTGAVALSAQRTVTVGGGVLTVGGAISGTNVGITNMDEERTVTFFVEFPSLAPLAVEVPPQSMRSIRIPGEGNQAREIRIYPDWAKTGEEPTPWVAYTSSVDTFTGDAWTGVRSLAKPQP